MDELKKYLNEALGLKIEHGEWLPDAGLPLLFVDAFIFASSVPNLCSKQICLLCES